MVGNNGMRLRGVAAIKRRDWEILGRYLGLIRCSGGDKGGVFRGKKRETEVEDEDEDEEGKKGFG